MANRMGVVGRCGKQKAQFVALMGRVKRFEVHRSMFRYLKLMSRFRDICADRR